MKKPMHVCQHTEEGQPACDNCKFTRPPMPSHVETTMRTASVRSRDKFPPKTTLLLKQAMQANDKERRRSHQMYAERSVNNVFGRRIVVHGVQHFLFAA